MELAEERCLASLRSCEMGPDDRIEFKDYVAVLLRSFDPDSICENSIPFMESILECSKKIRPPGKITTITVRWKLKENGFGHHLYLKWLPPESIDSKIESYYININNYVFRTKSSIPKFEMDILDPESSEYRVRIVAANHYHMGPYSEWVVAKELKPHPAPPEHLYCIERHYNYLKFWWGDEKRDDVEFFTLEMRSGKCCYSPPMELFCEERDKRKELSFTPVYRGPSLSYKLEDLVPDTEYEIRIYATNLAGEAGPYSDVHTFSTSHAVPCTVRTFRVLTMMEIKELRIEKLSLGDKKYPPVILKLLLKARKYRPCPRKYPLRIREPLPRIREPLPRIREPLPIIREPLPRPPRRGQNKYLPPRAIRTSPAARKCYICNSEAERTRELQQNIQLKRIPGAMRYVGVIPLVGGIHIRWLGPELTSCSFSYNVIIGKVSFNTNDNGTEIAIKGLDPDASYSIQIQAVSCVGPGPSSEVIQTRTRPGLPEPLQMKCLEACYNHLRLFWFSEKRDDNIISYRLEMLVLKRFKPIYHGPAVCCKVMSLEENTEYEFRACAFSLDGKGQYSDVYKFKTSSDTPNSSNKIVDQASSSAVKIEKATSYSEVMVQTATVSGMLRQTTSAFELMDQTATVSEIMEKVCPTPEVEKQTPVVDQDDHSSVNVEHVTFTSKMMRQSATASEVLEQTASAFELIGQTAIASEIMEQVYPTPKTENLVPVMDQAGPSSVVIEEVNPVSQVMEQTASTSEVMEQEETATASEVTEQAVTVSEIIELTVSVSEIIKQMYPPLEARKQFALKPSSLLRSSEDKNDFMDERDDGLSGKKSKKNKECILLGNSSSCMFYKRRMHFEEEWMDTFMNYIQELPLPDTVRERFYVCPSSCFSFLPGFPHGCVNKTSEEMLHRAFDMTVNVDLFEKDLIVLPILVDHQWSMAIVCYPGLIPQKNEYEEETEYLNLVHRRFSTVVHGDKKDKESSTSEKSTASAQKAQQAKVPCFYIFPIDSNHDSSVIAHGLKSLLEQLWEHYKDTERVLDFKNVKIFEVDFSDVRDIEPEMKLLHITEQFLKNPVPCSNLESFYDYFKTEVKDTPTPPLPPPLDITAKKLFRFLYHVTSRDILDLAEWNPNTISQWEGSLNWC